MTEELQKKAEDFIIERYKIAKCYREDNAETREYMRMDVHSRYEEEYKLYLAATKELQEENAELKDYRLTTLAKQQTGMSKYALSLEHKLSWYDNQLTKAKEIIKNLLSAYTTYADSFDDRDNEIVSEAEQFIKDSEVENV